MSKNESKPLSKRENLVVQEYGKEILIYNLTENKAFSLNETSALVWQACDGSRSVSEISAQVSAKLNSPVSEDFVWLALEQLKKDNLLENVAEISIPFEGVSRREIIRRVGFATLVALPVVSSLIAPTAIHAQSGVCMANCRCPNATPDAGDCAGSTTPVTVNCTTYAGTTTGCRCRDVGAMGTGDGPMGVNFRSGTCST